MANSNYVATVDSIIQEAYEQLQVLEEGDTYNTAQFDSALPTLAMLAYEWQKSINVFALQETFLFLVKNKYQYDTSVFSQSASTSYVSPGLTGLAPYVYDYNTVGLSAASSGATSITTDDATSIAADSVVGIPQADGSVHWTTVSSGGSTFTIADALTDDVDTSFDMVYSSSIMTRPLNIISAALRNFHTNIDLGLDIINYSDYNYLPNKTTTGQVSQLMYNREVVTGDLRVWQAPSTWDQCLVLWVHSPTQLLSSATDSIAASAGSIGFPQEFFWALSINLANRLINKVGCPRDVASRIERQAALAEMEAFNSDTMMELSLYPDLEKY
jgi:hypothetical protein